MSKLLPKLRHFEAYWLILIVLVVLASIIYLRHLVTGVTPSNVMFELFGLEVFWYGFLIMGGIALGAYVASVLAKERGLAQFDATVPAQLRQMPISELEWPAELKATLARAKVYTLGQLLLQYGWQPAGLGIKESELDALRNVLQADEQIQDEWLYRPSWYQWWPDHVWSGLLWTIILAVIGARLYHVFTPSPSMAEFGIESAADYFRQPFQLINLRRGGLGIYGGLAGGALGILIYTWRHGLATMAWLDLGAVGTALGQAVGRWGNFLNQELYGRPTGVPWAVHIDIEHRLDAYLDFARFHPAFLYESLWSLGTFLLLHQLARRTPTPMRRGELFGIYLIAYAVGRVLMELVRLDSRSMVISGLDLGLPVATVVSLLIAVVAAALIIWKRQGVSQTNPV